MAGTLVCSFLLACFVVLCTSQTTHRPPPEYDRFAFVYDPLVHMLGMSERYKGAFSCFLLALNADEQKLIHTQDGMTRLELKMLTHVDSATRTAMTLDQLTSTSKRIAHICGHATAIYTLSI